MASKLYLLILIFFLIFGISIIKSASVVLKEKSNNTIELDERNETESKSLITEISNLNDSQISSKGENNTSLSRILVRKKRTWGKKGGGGGGGYGGGGGGYCCAQQRPQYTYQTVEVIPVYVQQRRPQQTCCAPPPPPRPQPCCAQQQPCCQGGGGGGGGHIHFQGSIQGGGSFSWKKK